MNILVDLQTIRPDNLNKSVPIWIFRFLTAIKAERRKDYVLLVSSDISAIISEKFPDIRQIVFDRLRHPVYKGFYLPSYYIDKIRLKRLIRKNDIQCLFIPTDIQFSTAFNVSCRKVVVVHDLKALKRVSLSIPKAWNRLWVSKVYHNSLKTADKVIAISKYTKQDIFDFYPDIDMDKVEVVYNCVEPGTTFTCPKFFHEDNYILYVNTLQRYKNIMTLIRAFAKLKEKTDRNLVVVGKRTEYWDKEIVPIIAKESLQERVIRLENLTEEELNYMYKHADLFVTPSLHEGFGYTPIEAAMCETPVLCSIQESLPDVTEGKVAYYYPAIDEQALSEKISAIINNKPSTLMLSETAKHFIDKYQPSKQFEMIHNILTGITPPICKYLIFNLLQECLWNNSHEGKSLNTSDVGSTCDKAERLISIGDNDKREERLCA